MSRKIKFRAWKMRNGKMRRYVCTPFSFMKYAQTHIDEPVMRYSDVSDIQDFMPDADIIEQYTGLKDKNGTDIYEGDIVKCYSQDTYPLGRVMYSEEWCSYEIVSYDPEDCRVYSLESFSPTVNKYLEVIGNIHENPELLGGEDV